MSAAAMPPWWRSIQRAIVCAWRSSRPLMPPGVRRAGLGWRSTSSLAARGAADRRLDATGRRRGRQHARDAYGPEHMRLFETIAHTSAIVLEHERLTEDMRRSVAQNSQRAASSPRSTTRC